VVAAAAQLPDTRTAIDAVVELRTRLAVPEAQFQPGRIDQVDLPAHRRLHRDVGAGRHVAELEAVVGQRAAIIEDAINAAAEAAARRDADIDGAIEHQVAADLDEVVERTAGDIGLAEREVQQRTRGQREVAADRERAHVYARRQPAAGVDDDVAADGPDA